MCKILLLLVLNTMPAMVSSDEMKFGSCPEVEVVANFDYQKMLGKWYVIQKTGSISSCVTLDFKEDPTEGMLVEESLKPLGLSIPRYMERFTQVGTLRIPSRNFPSKMKVAYPLSIIPYTEVDFWIMETDYTTYAAIWSCRPLAIGHRQLAMIMSRNNVLDQTIVKKLRDKFESHFIDPHSLSIINHKSCELSKSNQGKPIGGSGKPVATVAPETTVQTTTNLPEEPKEPQEPEATSE